jgi:hypothetical protein
VELAGVIEKNGWVCEWNILVITVKVLWLYEWNFQVSYNRLAGFASRTFWYHRKSPLDLRVGLSGIIEQARWVLDWNFPVSQQRLSGFSPRDEDASWVFSVSYQRI